MKSLVWFITGASRGFGLEIARAVLERGDAVVAAARDPKVVEIALGQRDPLYLLNWMSPMSVRRKRRSGLR